MNRPNMLTLHDLAVDHIYTLLEKEEWQWQPPLTQALSDTGQIQYLRALQRRPALA